MQTLRVCIHGGGAQTTSSEKGHGATTVDQLDQTRNKLEQGALWPAQNTQRRKNATAPHLSDQRTGTKQNGNFKGNAITYVSGFSPFSVCRRLQVTAPCNGAQSHQPTRVQTGDRRAVADADQARQHDISGETKTARTLRTPEPPTDAARMAHNATHVPFRDWCPICVASRGRSSPHRRVVVNKTADTLPKFHTDYMFIRTVAESKTQPCITLVERRS